METTEHYFKTNKETWNKKVAVHAKSEMYNLKAFKEGENSLMKYELDALGDVSDKSLLHLQCHFGQDTLSWSRKGAKCTGIDLSDEGIKLARELNEELKLDSKFICCNVYDVNKHVSEQFDIVFTSYGAIGWLPDLKPWAKIIASRLKEGGVFFIAEFHPIVWMFDYLKKPAELSFGYNQKEVIYEEYSGTYADEKNEVISKEYGWNHGLGEIITALTSEGLQIEYLNEYDESPYDVFPDLVKTENGMFTTKDKLYPLIFTLKATKKS
ncbi:class I SAM-dependent methyltransferase [Tenacibaculum halocynthiae]|uniref:class I SAM-dependent methyltransferase n=1 Tax=Tenacibaculum halocynthiae TaxID=1254437 RepID=UPI003895A9A1